MTNKKDSEHSHQKVISKLKKEQSQPNLYSKNKTPDASKLKRPRAAGSKGLLSSNLKNEVLSEILREQVDDKWKACWPISALRPIAVLDLICYVLFIKKLEEKELIICRHSRTASEPEDEISWNVFKNLDGVALRKLFTEEKGIIDLIKNYSATNLLYSQFLKMPLSVSPTAKLLTNVIELVKMMEVENARVQAVMFEYLLYKTENNIPNNNAYSQNSIARLLVEIMSPSPADLVWDPCAGLGLHLVKSMLYIKGKSSAHNNIFDENYFARIYSGNETDPIRLRICAMNLIMNGIECPALNVGNISLLQDERELPSVIISNLIFEKTITSKEPNGKEIVNFAGDPEVSYLDLIVKRLRVEGRAAVVLPEYFLYNNGSKVNASRRSLIDGQLLEAVISLPHTGDEIFSGASIVILSKQRNRKNNRVWFYKVDPSPTEMISNNVNEPHIQGNLQGRNHDLIKEIILRWKNRSRSIENELNDDCFFVTRDEIIDHDYNLCFSAYRKVNKENAFQFADEQPADNNVMPVPLALRNKIRPVFEKINISKKIRPAVHKISASIVPTLILLLIAIPLVQVLVSKKNNNNDHVSNKGNFRPEKKVVRNFNRPINEEKNTQPVLTQQQIKKILYDTTSITHFDLQQVNQSTSAPDSATGAQNDENDNYAASRIEPLTQKTDVAGFNSNVRYAVVDTTFFYDEPIAQTRRRTYLDPLNKNVLKSLQDKNGFIYIVYTNALGRTSKGWISKKDLKPLQ